MFNVFKKKSFGQAVKSQALEQLPGFVVSTGFGLVGIGVMTAVVKVAQMSLEKKASQSQLPQQPQP